jgi:alpha-tubulin suppressor-like RCC1 family protein
MGIITNHLVSDGQGGTGTVDIGMNLVEKSYLIDRYPELNDTFKQAGLWLWGRNNNGQLGDNTITDRQSPVQTISTGANWRNVITFGSTQAFHSACIKTDGSLWLWGQGSYGALGNNSTLSRSSPVQTVSATTLWKQVSASSGNFGSFPFTAAIKTDGTLWLWGHGVYGQLGNNARTSRSSPVQTISTTTNWKQVSCGNSHAAAIKTDGTLWLWGSNGSGQLGDNAGISRSSPIQTIAGGTNWKQVSCGLNNTAAVKTDGTLWLWGNGQDGILGDNTVTNRSSPVQTVSTGTNWKQVVCGVNHTTSIKTDGTLWLWGLNTNGQLGDNTVTSKSSPVQTISTGTNWKQVSAGTNITSCIKTDGTLWMWGDNAFGQLGTNNTLRRSSPVQTVSGGTNWVQICLAGNFSTAIRDTSNDYL